MNDTITKIVNLLFADVVENEETMAMREEILNNCQERYQDLVSGGVEPETATAAIVESLKGMEEIISQYPKKSVENMPADEQAFREAGFGAVAQDYLEEAYTARENADGEYVFPGADVKSISIGLMNDDLIMGVSDDGMVHVLSNGNLKQLRAILSGGNLRIERLVDEDDPEADSGFHMDVHASNLGELFQSIFSNFTLKKLVNGIARLNDSMEITLLVPETCAISVNITSTNGDVTAEDVRMNDFHMTSTSGDVEMRDVVMNSLRMTTTSGDVDLSTVEVLGEMQLRTTSGDISFDGSCKNVVINTVSGDVDMNATLETAEIKTVSGDVDVTSEDATIRVFNAKSTSGDLTLTLPEGVPVEAHCRSVSGYVNQSHTSHSDSAWVSVQMQTVSGNISVE